MQRATQDKKVYHLSSMLSIYHLSILYLSISIEHRARRQQTLQYIGFNVSFINLVKKRLKPVET